MNLLCGNNAVACQRNTTTSYIDIIFWMQHQFSGLFPSILHHRQRADSRIFPSCLSTVKEILSPIGRNLYLCIDAHTLTQKGRRTEHQLGGKIIEHVATCSAWKGRQCDSISLSEEVVSRRASYHWGSLFSCLWESRNNPWIHSSPCPYPCSVSRACSRVL